MDTAWAAGFFDGDGTVGIWRLKKRGRIYYFLAASVAQVDPRPVRMLHKEYGGSLSRSVKLNPRHRTSFLWQVVSKDAAVFLRDVLPHLVVKREQVELALAFQHRRHPGRDGRTGWELAEQEAAYEALKESKHEDLADLG